MRQMVVYAGFRRCWVCWTASDTHCTCSNLVMDVITGLGLVTITVKHNASELTTNLALLAYADNSKRARQTMLQWLCNDCFEALVMTFWAVAAGDDRPNL